MLSSFFDWVRDLISGFLPESLQDEADQFVDQGESMAEERRDEYLG